jgi:hypothetical protein
VLWSALATSAPWFLAGVVGYLVVAAVILEPRWIRRAILLAVGYGLVDVLLIQVGYEAFTRALPESVLLAAFLSIAALVSAYRFRRGVR